MKHQPKPKERLAEAGLYQELGMLWEFVAEQCGRAVAEPLARIAECARAYAGNGMIGPQALEAAIEDWKAAEKEHSHLFLPRRSN